MNLKPRKRRLVKIELTPLIDVVFLLLIFFMVSTTFISFNKQMDIELPQADTANNSISQNVVITILKSGEIYLQNQPVSISEMFEKVKGVFKKIKNRIVVINADKNVEHGKVVKVMDIVKKAGAKELAIGTDGT